MKNLIAASLIWAFSFGLIKQHLATFDPFVISFLRLALAFFLFAPLLRRAPAATAMRLMVIGMVQFGLMYCLYIYSYRYLKAYEIALLTITTPVFVVFLDALIERRWRSRYWFAALLVVLATLVLTVTKQNYTPALKGVLLLQGANACFAAGQLGYKRMRGKGSDASQFGWLYLGGLLVPLLILGGQGLSGFTLPSELKTWLVLIYLGLVASGLAFFLWNKGVCRVNNGVAAVMNNLKFPLAVIAAWLVFGESVDWLRAGACGLLFAMALYLTGVGRKT